MHLHTNDPELSDWELLVRERVRSLRFGSVQITIHQGRVTQIEATEKIRVEEPLDGKSGVAARVTVDQQKQKSNQHTQ